jgi:hypothetical protein
MRPDPHTGALRDIVADLMSTGDGNTYRPLLGLPAAMRAGG